MKAAILTEPGRMVLQEVPTPTCPADGVLVEVKACGVCSADAKMILKGHRALTYPRIPGHEIAGILVESRTRLFHPGDRVQVAPGLRCGTCFQCLRGYDNQCEVREIFGFTRDGGFAQYVGIPLEGPIIGALTPLPDRLTCQDAVWAEPLACCINAQEKTNTRSGDTVVIIGGGPLGLLHAFTAKCRGAETVIVSEPLAHRRTMSEHSWADHILNSSRETLLQTTMEATSGRGADVLIFACSQAGFNDAWTNLLAPCGRISIFSGTPPEISAMRLDSNGIHYKELAVTGSYGCTAEHNRTAIRMMASDLWSSYAFETRCIPLANVEQGIADTNANRTFKTILEMSHGKQN